MTARPPVVVNLSVEATGTLGRATVEVERDAWDRMTPEARAELCDGYARVHAENAVGWGYHIDDPDTLAQVGTVSPLAVELMGHFAPDQLAELHAPGVALAATSPTWADLLDEIERAMRASNADVPSRAPGPDTRQTRAGELDPYRHVDAPGW